MGFRISNRVGPVQFSAWNRPEPRWEAPVFDAYQVNWPKRIAVIAMTFAPAWIAFGLGWGLLFGVLAIVAGITLIVAYGRSEGAHETDARSFLAWCGAVATGIMLAVLIGMLAEAILSPAQASPPTSIPAFDPPTYCTNVSALFGGTEASKANCLAGETAARQKVERVWQQTPDSIKDRCARLSAVAGTSSNYGALSGCLALSVGQEWLDGDLKLVP